MSDPFASTSESGSDSDTGSDSNPSTMLENEQCAVEMSTLLEQLNIDSDDQYPSSEIDSPRRSEVDSPIPSELVSLIPSEDEFRPEIDAFDRITDDPRIEKIRRDINNIMKDWDAIKEKTFALPINTVVRKLFDNTNKLFIQYNYAASLLGQHIISETFEINDKTQEIIKTIANNKIYTSFFKKHISENADNIQYILYRYAKFMGSLK